MLASSLVRVFSLIGVLCLALPVLTLSAQEATPEEQPFISGGLAWSPDGSQIAVGTSDGVWIHEADDLDNRRHAISGPFVTAMDWHPTENWIVLSDYGDGPDHLRIWDVDTGEILHVLNGIENFGLGVEWSPDGTMLASRSWSPATDVIWIWDAEGHVMQEFQLGMPTTDGMMDWSPDSRYLVANGAYPNRAIYVLDAQLGTVLTSWKSDGLNPTSLVWSPDGRFIASALIDVSVWDAPNGKLRMSRDFHGQSNAMIWSPNGEQLVLNLEESNYTPPCQPPCNRLVALDVESGEFVAESTEAVEMGQGYLKFNALSYSPDGAQIASISDDGRLLLLNSDDLALLDSFDDYRSILLEDMD